VPVSINLIKGIFGSASKMISWKRLWNMNLILLMDLIQLVNDLYHIHRMNTTRC